MKTSNTLPNALAAVLVIAGILIFVLRGPSRRMNGGDFASPYVSAQRLTHHQNPYTSANFLSDWHKAGANPTRTIDASGQHPIYPPTALVVFAPLTLFSWPSALMLYAWICSGAYLGLIWLLSKEANDSIQSAERIGFIIFGLLLAPVHSGIAQGNPSIAVFLLCGFALAFASKRDTSLSGVLLAIGFCVKPTSAIAIVVVLLLFRRIKCLLAFAAITILIGTCATIWMSRVPPDWKVDYQDNFHFLFGHDGAADFASDNSGRFDLVNLQVPLYSATHSTRIADISAIGITAVFLLGWIVTFHRERDPKFGSYWLAAGTLSLVALLPVYQRSYNAGVILFIAVWIFRHLDQVFARAALVASAGFMVPGEALLRRMGIADRFASNALWNVLIMSQVTWSILAVAVICLLFQARKASRYGFLQEVSA